MNPSNVTLPYRTCSGELFSASNWKYIENEELVELPENIQGWDYNRDLHFVRSLFLEPALIREQTGLNEESDIRLCCTVFCAESHYRRLEWISPEPIREPEATHEIKFSIKGKYLAEDIELITELVLYQSNKNSPPFTADKAGQILVGDKHKVNLEGSKNRFPIEEVSFDTPGPWSEAKQASWHLDWNPMVLDVPFMKEVRLYLNSKNPRFIEEATDQKSTIASFIHQDVARRILTGALLNEDFLENHINYETDSIGGVAARQLKIFFPSRGIQEVKNLFQTNRDRFETILQSKLPLEIPRKLKEERAKVETIIVKKSETVSKTEEDQPQPLKPPKPVDSTKSKKQKKQKSIRPTGQAGENPLAGDKGEYFELAVGGGSPVRKLTLNDLIISGEDKPRALTRSEFRDKFELRIRQAKRWYPSVYRFVLKRTK
jgi:hypothetical protein